MFKRILKLDDKTMGILETALASNSINLQEVVNAYFKDMNIEDEISKINDKLYNSTSGKVIYEDLEFGSYLEDDIVYVAYSKKFVNNFRISRTRTGQVILRVRDYSNYTQVVYQINPNHDKPELIRIKAFLNKNNIIWYAKDSTKEYVKLGTKQEYILVIPYRDNTGNVESVSLHVHKGENYLDIYPHSSTSGLPVLSVTIKGTEHKILFNKDKEYEKINSHNLEKSLNILKKLHKFIFLSDIEGIEQALVSKIDDTSMILKQLKNSSNMIVELPDTNAV